MSKTLKNYFRNIQKCDGLLALIDAVGLLSLKMHEGRSLKFAFIYADGRCWQVVQDTISNEISNESVLISSDFADYVEAHWSIFQQDRIVGLIDIDDIRRLRADNKKGIRISQMVRLKPYAELPGQLFKEVTNKVKGSYVVYSSGDGRVHIFTEGKEIIQWNTRTNNVEVIEDKVQEIVEHALTVIGISRSRLIKNTIEAAIQEVSEAQGEGAMLIISEEGLIGSYLQQMDENKKQMVWRQKKPIIAIDKTLLRAMLILDGATVIQLKEGDKHIEPRFVVYPHCKCDKAFSVLSGDYHKSKCPVKGWQSSIQPHLNLKELEGKGSKHHGAANLSVLMVLNNKRCLTNFKKYLNSSSSRKLNLPFCIITISADGPIKQWPDVLCT